MQFRLSADHELSGERFLRLLAARRAKRQVILNRRGEGSFQFVHGLSLERDDIAQIDDLAMKQSGILAEFDDRFITVEMHRAHGSPPASRKNRRTDLTAPLSVSGRGCGR